MLITGGVLIIYFLTSTNSMGGVIDMFFGISRVYEVNDIKEFDPGSIRKIEISVSSTDTNLRMVDSPKVKASLTGIVRTNDPSFVPYIEAHVTGSTLRIKVKTKSSFFSGLYSSNVSMELEIPQSFSGDLVLDGTSSRLTASELRFNSCSFTTSSGDIILGSIDVDSAFTAGVTSGRVEVERLEAASARLTASSGDTFLGVIELRDDFSADSTSGKIIIDRLSAANASLKNSSGNKKIAVMTVPGEVIIEGNSGTTTLDRISAGKLVINSTSGDVNTGSAHSGHTTIKTTSGRISVKSFEGDADLSSSSGSITLVCDKPASTIQIECSSGSINLGLPDGTQFSLNAQINSGSIKTDFALDQSSASKKQLQGSTGNGELDISLKTTSGNIKITKI